MSRYFNDELYHHGIKGMKWGVRRFQYSNGQYTTEGRSRYGIGDGRSYMGVKGTATAPAQTKSAYGSSPGSLSGAVSSGKAYFAKLKRQMSATMADVKNDIASSALGRNKVDTYLKAGTEFKRIQTEDTFEDTHANYMTYKKHDVNEYAGLFGATLKSRAVAGARANLKAAMKSGDKDRIDTARKALKDAEATKVYQVTAKNTKKLKIASTQNAAKITAGLLKNKEFKSQVNDAIADSAAKMRRPNQQALFSDASRALKKDPSRLSSKEKESIYKAVNLSLTKHNDSEIKMQNTFYNAMKKHGYGALVDLNDQTYSSYHASRPMIVFDNSGVKVSKTKVLSENYMKKLYKPYNFERLAKDIPQTAIRSVFDYGHVGMNRVSEYAHEHSQGRQRYR